MFSHEKPLVIDFLNQSWHFFFFLWSLHFSKVISVCCHLTFQKGGLIESPSTTQPWPSPFTFIAGSLRTLAAPPCRPRGHAFQPEAPPFRPRRPALQVPRPRPPGVPCASPSVTPGGGGWGLLRLLPRARVLVGDCQQMKRPAARWRGPRGKHRGGRRAVPSCTWPPAHDAWRPPSR